MTDTNHMPGTSVEPVPTNVVQCHVPHAISHAPGRDPASTQCFLASVADGSLSIILSKDGGMWHVSVAHQQKTRLPTWDELKWAKYTLVPEDVAMVLDFPKKSDPYVNVHQTCLHLWQLP